MVSASTGVLNFGTSQMLVRLKRRKFAFCRLKVSQSIVLFEFIETCYDLPLFKGRLVRLFTGLAVSRLI